MSTRVLFVGKPHRGTPGESRPSGLLDPRRVVEEVLRCKRWPYWRYTLAIGGLVHGTEDIGWDRIALTNLVKCTNVDGTSASVDLTTVKMVRCCTVEIGVIWAEIKLLRPTHVVFYTANLFPEIWTSVLLGTSSVWRDIERTTRQCGQKRLAWWTREAETAWANPLRVLITGHPERMQRHDYTHIIADWIRSA